MTMPKISVVIPSRTQPKQQMFLERALASVWGQSVAARAELEVCIGIDAGASPPMQLTDKRARFVTAASTSQAAAMNAAAAACTGDYIAMLEDDDRWHPNFLDLALEASAQAPFVSSTLVEVNERDEVLQVQDFPSPSGWFMTRAIWDRVGPFDPAYRWHLDNEWLGRLTETGVARFHLVEAMCPVHPALIQGTRPRLGHVLDHAGPTFRLARHHIPTPLVLRMAHAGSGMAQIARDAEKTAQSEAEKKRLEERYGRVPC
jgi:hypothetical protein